MLHLLNTMGYHIWDLNSENYCLEHFQMSEEYFSDDPEIINLFEKYRIYLPFFVFIKDMDMRKKRYKVWKALIFQLQYNFKFKSLDNKDKK